MADKLMYIPYDDTQTNPFCRFQLVIETFGHSTHYNNQYKINRGPKVVKPTNKKTFLYNFED